VGNFEQLVHSSPANSDEWASVMGDDGVNPDRHCWELGQRLSFLYWLLTLTRGLVTIFFGMKVAFLIY
jgi:hypothetical protein